MIQVAEAAQRSEWKDIADPYHIYYRYWSQWTFLVIRDGVVQRRCYSGDVKSKKAQVVLHRSKVKEALAKFNG
jgi:hypothetical protein